MLRPFTAPSASSCITASALHTTAPVDPTASALAFSDPNSSNVLDLLHHAVDEYIAAAARPVPVAPRDAAFLGQVERMSTKKLQSKNVQVVGADDALRIRFSKLIKYGLVLPMTTLQQSLGSGLAFDAYFYEEMLFSSLSDAPAIMGDFADNFRKNRAIEVDEDGLQVPLESIKKADFIAATDNPVKAAAFKVAAALSKGSSALRQANSRARAARTVRVLNALGIAVNPLLVQDGGVGLDELKASADLLLSLDAGQIISECDLTHATRVAALVWAKVIDERSSSCNGGRNSSPSCALIISSAYAEGPFSRARRMVDLKPRLDHCVRFNPATGGHELVNESHESLAVAAAAGQSTSSARVYMKDFEAGGDQGGMRMNPVVLNMGSDQQTRVSMHAHGVALQKSLSIYSRDLPAQDIFRLSCDLHSMRGAVLVLPSFYTGKVTTIVRPCIVAGVKEGELWDKIRQASHAHKPVPPPPSNADRSVPMILSAISVHLQGPGTVVLTNLILRCSSAHMRVLAPSRVELISCRLEGDDILRSRMLPFEALAFGLRGAEEHMDQKEGDADEGRETTGWSMDFGVSVGAGAALVCRACAFQGSSIPLLVGPGGSLLVVACSFTSSSAAVCACPSSLVAVHASSFEHCEIGVAACVASACCVTKCVFSSCRIATLSSTVNLLSSGPAHSHGDDEVVQHFQKKLPPFSFPAMIRAARLPGWRLTCAALRSWGRGSTGPVDAEQKDGIWERKWKGDDMKSGGDMQIFFGMLLPRDPSTSWFDALMWTSQHTRSQILFVNSFTSSLDSAIKKCESIEKVQSLCDKCLPNDAAGTILQAWLLAAGAVGVLGGCKIVGCTFKACGRDGGGGGVVVSCARGGHLFSSGLLQWRMLRPHAYLSRTDIHTDQSKAADEAVSSAESPAPPLHLSCLIHDLPAPPVSKARSFGVVFEDAAVKGGTVTWDNDICIIEGTSLSGQAFGLNSWARVMEGGAGAWKFETEVVECNFINGVGVVAVGAAQEEEDENFAKRAEHSWKDIYDVRERDRSMVMQSAFIVRYESFLSVKKSEMSCNAAGGCCARVLSGGDAIISSTSFKGPSSLRGQNGVMIMNNCTLCYGGGSGGVMVSVAADCRLFTAKCRFSFAANEDVLGFKVVDGGQAEMSATHFEIDRQHQQHHNHQRGNVIPNGQFAGRIAGESSRLSMTDCSAAGLANGINIKNNCSVRLTSCKFIDCTVAAVSFIGSSLAKSLASTAAISSSAAATTASPSMVITSCSFSSSLAPPFRSIGVSLRGGGSVMQLESCTFVGGDTGVSVMAGAVTRASNCTFSRHLSTCFAVGAMSVAAVLWCSATDSSVGLQADACVELAVVGGDVVKCNVGLSVSHSARASIKGLRVASCRVGMQALHDCSQVALVGCSFKRCGEGSCSGLQFGSSSDVSKGSISSIVDASNSSSSSSISSRGSTGVKCFGAILKHCVISSCGGLDGGSAVAIVSGSSVTLHRCSVASSLGDSVCVTLGSSVLMTMSCVYASAANAVVFDDKSTGQLRKCHLLSAYSTGLVLRGAANVIVSNGSISSCGEDGISAHGNSKVTAIRSHVLKNSGSGIAVDSRSLAMLTSCCVSGNVAHGMSATAANIALKCSCIIGNNMCGCSLSDESTADAVESTISGNRSDGCLHKSGVQCSTYEGVSCSGNNKSGLHLTAGSLVKVKDSMLSKNVRNGIQAEEGSTIMAERCSMFGNMEDGACTRQSSVAMTTCYFQSNGLGGSGSGMLSEHSRKLTVDSCVFAYQNTVTAHGLSVILGGRHGEEGNGQTGGSSQVFASASNSSSSSSSSSSSKGVASSISSCRFINNTIGCHVSLSADVPAPPIFCCKFMGNTKIGLDIVSHSAARDALGIDIANCSVNVSDWQGRSADDADSGSAADAAAAAAAAAAAPAGGGAYDVDRDVDDESDELGPEGCIGFSCGGPAGVVRGCITGCCVRMCQVGILSRDKSAIGISSCIVSGCRDAGIIARDGSSSAITSCRVSKSGIGAVLQAVAGGLAAALVALACDVGILVHGSGYGSVEDAVIRECGKGMVIAKGGGGLTMRNVRIVDGTTDGYLVQRSGRVVLQDCCAVGCGTGCRVFGDSTCSNCEWQGCGAGFISEPLSSCIASSMSATNCVEGIKLCGGDAVIKSCKASSCSGSGIVFQGSTSACSVTNASVQNCHTGISCLEGSVVHISSSSIVGIGGSGLTSRGHCNIFLDAVSIGEVEGNMVELAAHCSLRLFKCTLRASVGSGVVVSNLSSCTIQDTSISDCGGAGVESAGKITLLSSACNSNSSGVVLLQMTEAHLTNCSFAGNSLAGVWTIGDSCHLDGCTFEANRGCAFTAGKDTKFVEEKCSLLSNGSTSTFLIWKTARRSSTVEAHAVAAALSNVTRQHFDAFPVPKLTQRK